MKLSPDGTKIITSSWDKVLKVWEREQFTLLHTLEGHSDHITCFSFSPDGNNIVTSSKDKSIKIWDTSTGK